MKSSEPHQERHVSLVEGRSKPEAAHEQAVEAALHGSGIFGQGETRLPVQATHVQDRPVMEQGFEEQWDAVQAPGRQREDAAVRSQAVYERHLLHICYTP